MKPDSEGSEVKKTEQFVLDAYTYTEAETRMVEILEAEGIRPFEITQITKTNLASVIRFAECDKWFKVKVAHTSMDESKGVEKESNQFVLVSAADVKDAFEKVNRKFNEVYTKLFNGGSAKLELVDSDDPLDAGLEMLVSPPGKRLQSITLLSGGEQALTALSLIFAVFLTNPAPICVLDEVDAPLDDANVTRFCNLLTELTKITSTRFIIVTHHALTMSKMDRLYGVTMPEKGISQLVAVDLQKAESMVA